jgi:hypothetical protein
VTSRSSFWARRETPATGESPGISGLSWHGRYASQRHQHRTQQCVSGHEALSSTPSLGASGMLGAASQRAYVQLDPTSATHRSGGCSQGATSSESTSSQTPLGAPGARRRRRHPWGTPPAPRSEPAERNTVQNVKSRVSSERNWRSGRGDFGAPGLTRANDRSRPAIRAVTSSVRCPSGCPGRFRRLTRPVRGDNSTLPGRRFDRESDAASRNWPAFSPPGTERGGSRANPAATDAGTPELSSGTGLTLTNPQPLQC